MGCRLDPVEQPGGGEINRAGADTCGPRRRSVSDTEPIDDRCKVGRVAARHHDHVGGHHVAETGCRDERATARLIHDRTDLVGHEHHIVTRDVDEDLERPDDVKGSETRIEHESNLHMHNNDSICQWRQ